MNTFYEGQDLSTRSIGDSNCIYTAKVISRTQKSVRIDVDGKVVSRRIFLDYDGNEAIMPFGRYSMAPTFRA